MNIPSDYTLAGRRGAELKEYRVASFGLDIAAGDAMTHKRALQDIDIIWHHID